MGIIEERENILTQLFCHQSHRITEHHK